MGQHSIKRSICGLGGGLVNNLLMLRGQANTPLFHVPLHHLLTPFNSDLRSLLSDTDWASLGERWARLILVMMWETDKGKASRWDAYLSV